MTQDIHAEKILILDFGSQYTRLIARRVREANVYCEIHAWHMAEQAIRDFAPNGIILSGGPESVIVEDGPYVQDVVFELGVPILGICYGMQTLADRLGGTVEGSATREYGYAQVRARGHSRLFTGIEDHVNEAGHGLLDGWMSHGDSIKTLPEGFKVIATTDSAPVAGIADETRGYYGIQFHPEVTHTTQGRRILARFVHAICGCGELWQSQDIIDDLVARIRAQVKQGRVLLGLSGGVDSSVTAALLHRAIGDRLVCVFVDHGLLRLHEGDQVMASLAEHMGVNIIRVNAEEQFLSKLAGVADPEEKRKIIGNIFIEVFDTHAGELANIEWLAQGTIYPDVIESAGEKTGGAQLIKSHHNVGGLPEDMQLGLVEPLRELFKDEVRELGLALGLPRNLLMRHPFPGPGLGVRILGEVTKQYADKLRLADAIFIEELRRAGWYDRVSQAFAVYLPVSSVGVMGDGRRYEHVIALRAVETTDFMTARWAQLPYELLDRVSTRIVNEVDGISRVVYDITGKPPGTIEWE
jgi:GMP synthase (glutamine-hydrolysing)